MPAPITDRFHIDGSRHPRPGGARVVYADGAGASGHRPGIDVELSHWVPNRTDDRYKADTSTEICLRYVAEPAETDIDLVVNDHVDVDGILSLYSLLHPEPALANADAVVAAAAMGDFHSAADRPGFRLAQELSLMLFGDGTRPDDAGDCYALAFEIATSVLEGTAPESGAIANGWAIIERGHQRLEHEVTVESVTDRLVSFVYPAGAADDLGPALKVPALNEVVDESVWLWPEVRNHRYGEAVHLVSVPFQREWFHDVWAPSYCWAETPDRWPLPGLVSTGDSNRWRLEHEPLRHAIAELDATDTAAGRWVAADQLTPFETMSGRAFPVVASFVDEHGSPAPSDLAPERVSAAFAPVW